MSKRSAKRPMSPEAIRQAIQMGNHLRAGTRTVSPEQQAAQQRMHEMAMFRTMAHHSASLIAQGLASKPGALESLQETEGADAFTRVAVGLGVDIAACCMNLPHLSEFQNGPKEDVAEEKPSD